jgi:hypothetical protein
MGVVAMTPPSFSLAAFRRLEVDFRAIAVSVNSTTVTTILQFQVFSCKLKNSTLTSNLSFRGVCGVLSQITN